jgi:hypothetical protein
MEPRTTRLVPGLDRWSQEPEDGQKQNVVVHISPSGDPDAAVAELKRVGAEVVGVVGNLITVLATRSITRAVARQPWVSIVQEPTELTPEDTKLTPEEFGRAPFGSSARRS